MGKNIVDQYAYLHLATGVITYFWGISLMNWIVLHTIFEIVENTAVGISIINKYFTFWPGGKPYPDSMLNSVGDTIFAILGWVSAYYLDKIGTMYGWYKAHLK